MRAVEALQEFAPANGVPDKAVFGLALALEECASNIVNHALQRDARQKFQVMLESTDDHFIIELRDRGPEFDPTVSSQEPREEDALGGWGIELVRRYIDEIHYTRADGENILRLDKRLSSSTPA